MVVMVDAMHARPERERLIADQRGERDTFWVFVKRVKKLLQLDE